ncbi:MAG: hypothetical protein KDD55_10400, partial [Bdellovibrionales bacterium]|nr:hypothetical protein [Bdellovibrionales bacterium]
MFRSKYSYLFFLPFLVLLFILINPYWYGDGVWYALELKAHERLIPDAGHLIWIPLAFYLWKLLSIFYLELDPLLSLQLLSALGAVFLLHATYLVTRSLEFSKRSSSLTIITLACTHFMLVYGGSGSSYTCAAAALTYST